MDRLQLALERAKAAAHEEGRKDGEARKRRIGQMFPVLRDDYARGFAETYRKPRMGRPPKDLGLGTEQRPGTMAPAASSSRSVAPVDLLPTDATLRRGVAGRVTAGSSAAPAGVL